MNEFSILYVGENWLGSCARSFCEALRRIGIEVEEIHESSYMPKWNDIKLRVAMRLLKSSILDDLEQKVINKVSQMEKRIVVCYKGAHIRKRTINQIKDFGVKVINIYPDCSPIAQGKILKDALGEYDLVVSTKRWHPEHWNKTFGYQNKCIFIPQGFDPQIHYQQIDEDREQPIDILLIATYREEYGDLIKALCQFEDLHSFNFHVIGAGWNNLSYNLPVNWKVGLPVHGYAYRKTINGAKVCLAPLTREVIINGRKYPGDEDTTRTYELPAMGAFFIHRRTDYVKTLFDESKEVPMYDTAEELHGNIVKALKDANWRMRLRKASHLRCIARDSLDNRASEFVSQLQEMGFF